MLWYCWVVLCSAGGRWDKIGSNTYYLTHPESMRAHAVGEEENTVSYQQKVDRVQYEQSARHQWKSRIAYNQREGITQLDPKSNRRSEL